MAEPKKKSSKSGLPDSGPKRPKTRAANSPPSDAKEPVEPPPAMAAQGEPVQVEPSPAESAQADSAPVEPPKPDETSVDYEVVTPPATVDPRRGGGWLVFTLFLTIIGLSIYATWPLWSPYVAQRFPALEYKATVDPRVAGLTGRLEVLEAQTSRGVARNEIISDMEKERQRLQLEVGQLLVRLDNIEKTIEGVKDIVVATGVKTPTDETKRVLEEITARLAELEKTGNSYGTLDARVGHLEDETARESGAVAKKVTEAQSHMDSMIGKIEDRLVTLETTEATQQSSQSVASAIILAISQLRKSADSGKPFETDIETLKALGKNHTEMQAALSILEKAAITGTATIDQLRNQFAGLAANIIRADNIDAGNSWFESAKKRVLSLVSIRKLGVSSDTVTVDSLVVLTEDHLRSGDIAAAVQTVEQLKTVSIPASLTAEPWLQVANNRLKTERAIASLHVYAVSLIASGKS